MHFACMVICKNEMQVEGLLEKYLMKFDNWTKSLFHCDEGGDDCAIIDAIHSLIEGTKYTDYDWPDTTGDIYVFQEDPDEKMDYYIIGGRASEILYSKGRYCTYCKIDDLDFDNSHFEYFESLVSWDGKWQEGDYVNADSIAMLLESLLGEDLSVFAVDYHI